MTAIDLDEDLTIDESPWRGRIISLAVLLLVGVVVAAGLYFFYFRDTSTTTTRTTEDIPVKRGTINQTLIISGTADAELNSNLIFQSAGKVAKHQREGGRRREAGRGAGRRWIPRTWRTRVDRAGQPARRAAQARRPARGRDRRRARRRRPGRCGRRGDADARRRTTWRMQRTRPRPPISPPPNQAVDAAKPSSPPPQSNRDKLNDTPSGADLAAAQAAVTSAQSALTSAQNTAASAHNTVTTAAAIAQGR